MANKTIDTLPSASAINDNDLFVLQQSSTAKKLLGSLLKQYISGQGGISSITLNADYTLTVTYTNGTTWTSGSIRGAQGNKGDDGDDGVGISNIAKTGTVGKVDTYTITLTNGNTYTFTVTNGNDGQGAGDMLASTYDDDLSVANAGGIADYIVAQGFAEASDLTSHTSNTSNPHQVTAEQLGLSQALKFIGISSTAITDGGTEEPTISGYVGTAKTVGNVVIYSNNEFVWANSVWNKLGDDSSWQTKINVTTGALLKQGSSAGSVVSATSGTDYQAPITSSTDLTVKTLTGGLAYETTAPSAANSDGIKIVVLSSEPSTKYSGWLYLITGT